MIRSSETIELRSLYRIIIKISPADRIITTREGLITRVFIPVKNSKELYRTMGDILLALLGRKHDYSISSGKDYIIFSRI